jgi:hypothetical protein
VEFGGQGRSVRFRAVVSLEARKPKSILGRNGANVRTLLKRFFGILALGAMNSRLQYCPSGKSSILFWRMKQCPVDTVASCGSNAVRLPPGHFRDKVNYSMLFKPW